MTSTMQLHTRVMLAVSAKAVRRAICFARAFFFSPFPGLRRMHPHAARENVLGPRVAHRGTGAGAGIHFLALPDQTVLTSCGWREGVATRRPSKAGYALLLGNTGSQPRVTDPGINGKGHANSDSRRDGTSLSRRSRRNAQAARSRWMQVVTTTQSPAAACSFQRGRAGV